jgi:hypothetical protein
MLSNKNCVLLRSLLSSTSNDKHTRYKREKDFATVVAKGNDAELVRIALVDASNGWTGVKRECVLLKRKG